MGLTHLGFRVRTTDRSDGSRAERIRMDFAGDDRRMGDDEAMDRMTDDAF